MGIIIYADSGGDFSVIKPKEVKIIKNLNK